MMHQTCMCLLKNAFLSESKMHSLVCIYFCHLAILLLLLAFFNSADANETIWYLKLSMNRIIDGEKNTEVLLVALKLKLIIGR